MSDSSVPLNNATEPCQPGQKRPHSKKNADVLLLLAFASGASAAEAARQAGVSERTAFRRLHDPDFRRRIAQARDKMVDDAMGQLAQASVVAVGTLRALCTAESETVRLGAARSLLELTMRLREHVELGDRVSSLEARHRNANSRCFSTARPAPGPRQASSTSQSWTP